MPFPAHANTVAKPDQSTQPVSEFDSAITAITFEASAGGLTAALTAATMDFGVRWRTSTASRRLGRRPGRYAPAGGDYLKNRLPPPWLVRRLLRFRNALGAAHTGMVPPELVLLERSYGLIHSKALMLAAELGIADPLEQGPQTAEQLARVVDANPDVLDRMRAFLVSGRALLGGAGGGGRRDNRLYEHVP